MADSVRLGTGKAGFVVTAAVEIPMVTQERAGRSCLEALSYFCPGRIAVPADVITGNLVRDTLVAKVQKQPIEQSRCVAPSDRGLDSFLP